MKTLQNQNLKVWEKYGKTRYYINNVSEAPCFIDIDQERNTATLVYRKPYRGLEEDMFFDRLEEQIGSELMSLFCGNNTVDLSKFEEIV